MNVPVGGCGTGLGDDEIHFASGLGPILLTADLPEITTNVEIWGQGQGETIIDGDDAYSMIHFGDNTIGAVRDLQLFEGFSDSASAFTGVYLSSEGARIVVEDVTIDSCRYTGSAFVAPVVFNVDDTSELRRATLIGNRGDTGSGVLLGFGGAFTGEDLLFTDNVATGSLGALALGASSMATVRRSTFTGNEASQGAAISVFSSAASIVLEHSTISGNKDTSTNLDNGAVRISGTLTLFNSIIAGNLNASPPDPPSDDSPDLVADGLSTLIPLGHNVLGTNDGDGGGEVIAAFPLGLPNANGDYVGQVSGPLSPQLGPLQDNGGPTATMMPSLSSPSIDRGSCPGEIARPTGAT